MSRTVRSDVAALVCATAFLALCSDSARPQQPAVGSSTDAPAAGTGTGADLHLIANLDPSLRIDRLKDALLSSAENTGCTFDGEPLVRPMSREAINEIFPGLIPEEGATVTVPNKTVTIGRIPSLKSIWELRMTDEESLIKSMEIKLKDGGETLNLKPGFTKSSLIMTRPGYYSLELDPAKSPASFSLELGKIDGSEATPVKDVPWPETERYYSIQLRMFQGDIKAMMANMEQLTNKVYPVQGPAKQYAFASFSMKPPLPGSDVSLTEYTAVVEGLGAEFPTERVWILFPLSKDSCEAARDKYKNVSARELPTMIRSESPSLADAAAPPMTAEAKPRWIELTTQDGGQTFKRSMAIDDLDQLFEKYPELWYVTAWEAGGNGQFEVYYVQNRQDTGSESFPVSTNQDRKWSEAVPKLLQGKPSASDAKSDAKTTK